MRGVLGVMRESHCYRVMIWIDVFFLDISDVYYGDEKDLQLLRSGLK